MKRRTLGFGKGCRASRPAGQTRSGDEIQWRARAEMGTAPARLRSFFERLSRRNAVYQQTGNLSPSERSISALAGTASLLAAARAPLLLKGVLAVAGLGLIARAAAGHCAVKSALRGDASIGRSVSEQWSRLRPGAAPPAREASASRQYERQSRAIDESVDESFPASDPPASRLPDEPPVNAEAKWQAAAAAGQVDR